MSLSENITVLTKSVLIQGWHQITSQNFNFTNLEQRDHGNLISSVIRALSVDTAGVLKNSKLYWDKIIDVFQYS